MSTPAPDTPDALRAAHARAVELVRRSGFSLTPSEWRDFALNDFGLGQFHVEGFSFVDLLRSPRLRITLLVLLPGQSLPEHRHPSYEGEPGKEETLRVLFGEARVCTPGEPNNPALRIPLGKEALYTARHEILLRRGEQFRIAPGVVHWFQGGTEGCVTLAFQNRVDETRNIFTDPSSTGCPIRLEQL